MKPVSQNGGLAKIFTNTIEDKLTCFQTTVYRLDSKILATYSHLSNKRGGWNKRGGGAKVAKSKNVEVGILQLESSAFVFKQLRYWVKHIAFTAKL